MSLLQLLQEASSLPLGDLKRALKRDKHAALVLRKELTLGDIPDVTAFLSSVKFHLLNNEKVHEFVRRRADIKDLSERALADLRQLKAGDLTPEKLNDLHAFVTALFREYAFVERGGLSRELKRELNEWFNTSGHYYDLPPWAVRELDSIPGLRPERRQLLYRGLLFTAPDFEERERYDGTLEVGNGLKFLRSIRKGERTVDLTWDRPASWTKHREVARRFAQYGPASSSFLATLRWLDRSMSKRSIDGDLGFIISTFARPEDVLLDVDRLNSNFHLRHGNEGEVILRPGKYTCRIVKKYTVRGEINLDEPEANGPDLAKLDAAVEGLKRLNVELGLPEGLESIADDRGELGAAAALKDISSLRRLVLNSTTTKALHAHDKVIDFYKNVLKDLDAELLSAVTHAGDPARLRQARGLHQLIEHLQSKVAHSKFKPDKNGWETGKGPRHDLSADEYRATIRASDLGHVEAALLQGRKIDAREGGNLLARLAELAGVAPARAPGAAEQAALVDDIIDGLFKKLGLDKHEERQENIKLLLTLVKKAYRNYAMLKEQAWLKGIVEGILNAAA